MQAIISGAGWKAFRQDNHLEEGDICVLEELPAAAVKKYGHQMGDHIFLKVPNWEEPWKVKLRNEVRAVIISSRSSGDEQENEARVIAISSGSSGDEHEIEARAK
ncbi:hypothetical protein ACLB2K_075559 [Fragaria x ananassa]